MDAFKGCGYMFLGILVLATIITVCVVASGCGDNLSPRTTPNETPTTSETSPTKPSEPATRATAPTVQVPISVSQTAINSIKGYPGVMDAAITKSGNQVSLVLVVDYSINNTVAKQLGENFVRLYKSMSNDDPPGKSVGKGRYDYLIGVYYQNEKQIALGGKVSFAEHISW